MSAVVQKIVSVEPYGETLSVVTTSEGHKVIANKTEDGNFRWEVGEVCVYVSEGSILPAEVLKDRGYWDTEKDRGLLDGGARNRVKMKKLAGFESRGLLFKTHPATDWESGEHDPAMIGFVSNPHFNFGSGVVEMKTIHLGEDVSEVFGITEFQG